MSRNSSIEQAKGMEDQQPGSVKPKIHQSQFNEIVELLQSTGQSPDNSHLLICGPRGSGKTELLHQVIEQLQAHNHHLPIKLMTQSHEILTLADFYLEVLFHLVTALSPFDNNQAENVLTNYQALARNDHDQDIIAQAQQILQEVTQSQQKKLLLCIENIHELARDSNEGFTQELQQLLLQQPYLVIVATATSPLVKLSIADLSLVKLFEHIELPPLDLAQCESLWATLKPQAQSHNLRPLHILSHGIPSALVAMSQASSADLGIRLDTLINRFNDYFQLHLKSIAPKERKVYLAVVDLWYPSSTKEITIRSRLEMRAVSALLGRLVSKGLVLEYSTGKNGKGKRYEATDPFLCLYYQLARQPDNSGRLSELLKFMSVYYRHKDWKEQRQSLLNNDDDPTTAAQQLCYAPWDSEPLAQQFLGEIDINQLNIALGTSIDAFDWFAKYISPVDDARAHGQYLAMLEHSQLLARQPVLNQFLLMQCAAADFSAQALLITGQPMAAITAYQSIIDNFEKAPSGLIQVLVAQAYTNMGVCFEQLDQLEAASKYYSDGISKASLTGHEKMPQVKARALYLKGQINLKQGKPASAVNALARLSNEFEDHPHPVLQIEVARSYLSQGLIWLGSEQVSHAVKSLVKLTEHFSTCELSEVQQCVVKGHLLLSYAAQISNKMPDAIEHLNTLLSRWQNKKADSSKVRQNLAEGWLQRAMLLYKNDQADEAMQSLGGVFSTSAEHGTPSYSALTLVTYLAADVNKIPQLLALFHQNPALELACMPMVLALKQEVGDKVSAPKEHLLVAEDIRENIARVRAMSEVA